MSEQKPQLLEPKRKLKVVLLGDRAVGKSSIIRRFVSNQFQQHGQPTVGVDFMSKNIKYKSVHYKIQLWDTAGQQKYRSLVKGYLKGADACIFVYDCTNMSTYTSIIQWMSMFDSVSKSNAYSIIVGNKCDNQFDLEKLEKDKEQFKETHKQLENIYELMASAKVGVNISQIFQEILNNYSLKQQATNKQKSKSLNFLDSVKKMGCC